MKRTEIRHDKLMAIMLISACTLVASHQAMADPGKIKQAELGPRPMYLYDQLEEGDLKAELAKCKGPYKPDDFSIGHRGAALQFPEHTQESYVAAARMGAGILECDVTFTSDTELVCRHDECDLHTTTNILATGLASTCETPFTPAVFDEATGERISAATARCCTSALTLDEFKSLVGKMDASNPDATTVEEYLGGTANFRTDLYATGGTLLSLAESIELFESLGAKHTPELKAGTPATVTAVFGSQPAYAQALIDEFKSAGVNPSRVWAQSFNLADVLYWLENEPAFGQQAVFLDGGPVPRPNPGPFLQGLADDGVRIVAPPIPMLLSLDGDDIVPSDYALAAQAAGLDIITWTLERSGRIVEDVLNGGQGFYYQTVLGALENDGDILKVLDVLAREVGVIGVFSDWPATTTYYANCVK